MAGESARKKAERLARQADYYQRGAEGEEATATALSALAPRSWAVIHDVAWPGRKLANIDHVVVGPSGVYVIDSKNWSGKVAAERGVLRQNGYHRTRSIRNAQDAALTVAAALPGVRPEHVVPVLCFMEPAVSDQVIDNTLICSTHTLVPTLSSRPAVFTAEGVVGLAADLRRSLPAATDPRPAPVGKVATVRAGKRPASPRRGRRTHGVRRLVASAALGAAFLVALNTGAFTAVTGVLADLVVKQTELPDEEPTQPKDDRVDKKRAPSSKKANH